MENKYRLEMERLGPRQEELERLYTMIEEGTLMNKKKKLGLRAAIALACAALMTVLAAAAAPTVWDVLTGHLGVFAPYAQTIEGAVCRDKGIEVQVLSALSDDLEGEIYLAVRDLRWRSRLDSCLTLNAQLEIREENEPDPDRADQEVSLFSHGSAFKLLSYDPDTKTALFSANVEYGDDYRPAENAKLSITGMSTQKGYAGYDASCASVTSQTLDSLLTEGDVFFGPSDEGGPLDVEAIERGRLRQVRVLAPDQNSIPLEDTEDMWISSMGFASDGCFHIRLGLVEGIEINKIGFFCGMHSPEATDDERLYTFQETLVDGDIDILFPQLHPEDLALIQSCTFQCYGYYIRPGVEIEGDWTIEFPVEYYPSITLDWTGKLRSRQVEKITLSPLSVTLHGSGGSAGLHTATLYAVKKDGSTVAAQPGTGLYSNGLEGGGWEIAYNTWKFEEPVDLDEVVALQVIGTEIPVN